MADEFFEYASKGSMLSAFRYSALYAVLWAIGTSWSTAIRSIVLELFPHDTMDIVIAELSAAAATTILGLGIAYVSTRPYGRCCDWVCRSFQVNSEEERKAPRSSTTLGPHSVMRTGTRG